MQYVRAVDSVSEFIILDHVQFNCEKKCVHECEMVSNYLIMKSHEKMKQLNRCRALSVNWSTQFQQDWSVDTLTWHRSLICSLKHACMPPRAKQPV